MLKYNVKIIKLTKCENYKKSKLHSLQRLKAIIIKKKKIRNHYSSGLHLLNVKNLFVINVYTNIPNKCCVTLKGCSLSFSSIHKLHFDCLKVFRVPPNFEAELFTRGYANFSCRL